MRLLSYDFGGAVVKDGISRIINGKLERPFYSSPCLRVRQFFRVELWVTAWSKAYLPGPTRPPSPIFSSSS